MATEIITTDRMGNPTGGQVQMNGVLMPVQQNNMPQQTGGNGFTVLSTSVLPPAQATWPFEYFNEELVDVIPVFNGGYDFVGLSQYQCKALCLLAGIAVGSQRVNESIAFINKMVQSFGVIDCTINLTIDNLQNKQIFSVEHPFNKVALNPNNISIPTSYQGPGTFQTNKAQPFGMKIATNLFWGIVLQPGERMSGTIAIGYPTNPFPA